ncbi:MAG: Eco57I restriction-modification methylase domain-containing protein, partial [Bdellovibrionaceae bacterium]|nr:Eco57I restriction-modification methylase domain-containing protein [Pseudobdellovibrionaceae bacterium]
MIEDVFKTSYKYESWKRLLTVLFPNADFYNTPIQSVDKTLAKHSIVKSISEFGSAKLVDGKLIRFYDVGLEKGKSVNKNRVGLRNVIHTELNPGDTDALFAVYHVEDETDWRLTFISKSIYWDKDFVEHINITHPKRFTYVLGANETVRTAVSQFETLTEKKVDLKSLINAFSVEKLNREFFTLYKSQYEKFFRYLVEHEGFRAILLDKSKIQIDDQEKPLRDFTKKLLGRIVFLYFLQKKGWMGCPAGLTDWQNGDKQFLLNLFTNFEEKDRFLSICLSELFFNTLNRRAEFFKFTGTRVPYLNGGLFEPDEPKASRTIDFPVSYFEKLFDFFSEYNFTIDENSPDDHEVGIDPEMLGHIFENLLDDNKGNGTFYTPKEIVQYMTQESLIQYLETHLGKNEAIAQFIRYGQKGDEKVRHNFIRDNAKKIEELLDNVKICDPAIGSGAFPMGMLHEIFKAKLSLDWTLDRVEVKKNIIQKSIYGVDLDSGAIDIARLRFWLALIVDEDEPHPLPNLDFKIMQGNSLLEKFEGIDLSKIHEGQLYNVELKDAQIDMFSGRSKKKVSQTLSFERIEDLMNSYYGADNPDLKKDLHQRIDKHVLDHIHFTLEEHKTELIKDSKKYIKNISTKVASLKTAEQKLAFQNDSRDAKNLKNLNLNLDQINQKEIELFRLSQSSDRPFFLWHLFFKEVFDQGGFDILIGNPPYINANALKKMYGSVRYDELKSGYKTAKGTIDIYILFYELGINILKEGGVLSYINPNRYLSASYGEELRRFIYDTTQLISLADYSGIKVFKEASTYPVVTILQKSSDQQESPIAIRHFNSL